MNVFDAIHLKNNDPIESSFIAAETALDIAVATANKDYFFESGLISLSDNDLFIESEGTDSEANAKTENAFLKAIKAICTAIKNFISDLVSSIASIFDKRENITAEDYLESPTGKVRLEKDIRKLEYIVDDEIRKGNKLLQKVSSKTGIPDETIDNWVRSGTEKINKLLPVVIPAAVAFGFTQLFKMQNKKTEIDKAEKEATTGDTTDSKKNQQKMTIIGHMNNLLKHLGNGWRDWSRTMERHKKKAK